MKDEDIAAISKILTEWNPLGDLADQTRDLEVYRYEAMDILSVIDDYGLSVERAVSNVLTEAFNLTLNKNDLIKHSILIEQAINKK